MKSKFKETSCFKETQFSVTFNRPTGNAVYTTFKIIYSKFKETSYLSCFKETQFSVTFNRPIRNAVYKLHLR